MSEQRHSEDWTMDAFTSRRRWSIAAADSRADAIRRAVRRLRRAKGRVSIYRGDRLMWRKGKA